MRLHPLVLAVALLGAPAASAQAGGHAGLLADGDAQLSSGEYYDTYTLDVRAGQHIEADLGSAAFDPYLIVVAPSGAAEENDDHEGSRARSHVAIEATESGTYRVLATSYGVGETGEYVLALRVRDAAEAPAARPVAPPVPGAAAASPSPPSTAGGRPAGLFYMQRYWIATSHLEKAVWYFAPDGQVYFDPTTGLSAQELAAHAGQRGAYRVADGVLTVSWTDGTTSTGDMESVSAAGFNWNGGLFAPAPPFAPGRSFSGTFTGGSSMTFSGSTTLSSTTFDLRPDGTYTRQGGASILGEGYTAGGTGGTSGTWSASGYTLTLAEAGGPVRRLLAFPLDDDATPAYPDRLFIGGFMLSRP